MFLSHEIGLFKAPIARDFLSLNNKTSCSYRYMSHNIPGVTAL